MDNIATFYIEPSRWEDKNLDDGWYWTPWPGSLHGPFATEAQALENANCTAQHDAHVRDAYEDMAAYWERPENR